ncbi:MAG: hypothetical protein Q8L47_02195 [bacterium]|nr:hypothetical protein [bacterium]
MVDAIQHDAWNRCGHPDILDKWLRPDSPNPERQTFSCSIKDLAESHCKCCGGELVISIGFNLTTAVGVCATITCPKCSEALDEESKIRERELKATGQSITDRYSFLEN